MNQGGHKFSRMPLAIGAVAILSALVLEYLFQPFRGSEEHPANSLIFTLNTIVLVVAELGYAFVIAWIVSWFIERRSQAAHLELLSGVREQIQQDVSKHIAKLADKEVAIASNVFEATAGMGFPSGYVQSVIESSLSSTFMREAYDISYRLEPLLKRDAARLKVDVDRFVLLHVTIRYTARNVSQSEAAFSMTYGLPLRRGTVRELTRVTEITVGDRQWTPDELKSLATYDEKTDERDYRIETNVERGKSVPVVIKAVIVKEMSDSEVFGFRDPTMRLALRLTTNVEDLRFDAYARSATKMREVSPPDGRTGEWEIDGPLLPNNSVTIWWRNKADEGEISSAEP